jgi:hypothetical protein
MKLAVDCESMSLARGCKAYYEKNKKYMDKVDDSIIPAAWLKNDEDELSASAESKSMKIGKEDKEIEVSSSSESWQESSSADDGESFEFSDDLAHSHGTSSGDRNEDDDDDTSSSSSSL